MEPRADPEGALASPITTTEKHPIYLCLQSHQFIISTTNILKGVMRNLLQAQNCPPFTLYLKYHLSTNHGVIFLLFNTFISYRVVINKTFENQSTDDYD